MSDIELLELHFWDGKPYDVLKVKNFFRYISCQKPKPIILVITIICFDITSGLLDSLYEHNREIIAFNLSDGRNSNFSEMIGDNFVEHIAITFEDSTESFFHVNYCEKNIYYSYEFIPKTEYEDLPREEELPKIFDEIKLVYINLIQIFQPLVSNAGFEVLWEDLPRIRREKCIEGIFWYLAKDLDLHFLTYKRTLELRDGTIFSKF